MYTNPSLIPSVQVGAGIPLQSTSAAVIPSAIPQAGLAPGQIGSVAQSGIPIQSVAPVQSIAQTQSMQTVQSGSLLQVPPGTMVPVQVGNSIVQVPTQPVATQQVTTQSIQVPVQSTYQTTSYQPTVENQYIPDDPNTVPAPQYGQTQTPTLKTLQPRIIRNQLPPQHKTVTLPAKIVTTRLPPIGPPPTPELNLNIPPPALPPMETVESVVLPQPVQQVQTYQSVQQVPVQSIQQVPVQSIQQVPVQSIQQVPVQSVLVSQPVQVPIQSVVVPQYQTTSVPLPNYQTAPIVPPSQPRYGSTSVVAHY